MKVNCKYLHILGTKRPNMVQQPSSGSINEEISGQTSHTSKNVQHRGEHINRPSINVMQKGNAQYVTAVQAMSGEHVSTYGRESGSIDSENGSFLWKTMERLAAQQDNLQIMLTVVMERMELADKWKAPTNQKFPRSRVESTH